MLSHSDARVDAAACEMWHDLGWRRSHGDHHGDHGHHFMSDEYRRSWEMFKREHPHRARAYVNDAHAALRTLIEIDDRPPAQPF